GATVVDLLDGDEECEIVEPAGVLGTEPLELGPLAGRRQGAEALVRLADGRLLKGHRLVVADALGGAGWGSGELRLVEPAALDERFQIDQERIAGEGRTSGIGRVAKTDRPERHDLPEGLAGSCEKVDEAEGASAEVTDAQAERQGGGVQEDAAGAAGVGG